MLVKTGLLPNGELGNQTVTLTDNEVGHFVCKWVDLAVGKSACKFVKPEDFDCQLVPMQIAHGEGLFTGSEEAVERLIENNQIVFRYADVTNNPNRSVDNIAGICDSTGLILGMMPHPERSVAAFHPHRIRTAMARQAANTIFNNIVNYTRES